MLALANVIASALLHALWNALLRLERDKDRTLVTAVSIATLLALVVAGVRWALGTVPFCSSTDRSRDHSSPRKKNSFCRLSLNLPGM